MEASNEMEVVLFMLVTLPGGRGGFELGTGNAFPERPAPRKKFQSYL